MNQLRKEFFKPKELGKTGGAIFGTLIYALGLNLFIIPVGVYSGGVMGISQIIRTLLANHFNIIFTNFDLAGIIFYLINIPLFFLAYKTMGKLFFTRTLISVTSMSLFLTIIPLPSQLLFEGDVLASCLIGGIIAGIGLGLTLLMGGCSGGVDIIAIHVIKKKGNFSIGKANIIVDSFVYSLCFILFDVTSVLYSIIVAGVMSVATDRVHIQNINVEVTIITKNNVAELESRIIKNLNRGVTKWKSTGAYTGNESEIIYIILSKFEVAALKRIVKNVDPNAFIVVKEGVWVDGNYLKKL